MKITVITPTFNQAEFIEETIKSVLEQTHKDIEYLIIDNESNDGTEEIVRKYANADSRITYIRESDKGQAEAINKGLNRATGQIVCWLNSDDFFYNNSVLEEVNDIFTKDSNASVITGDAWYSDRDGNLKEEYKSDRKVPDWVISRWYYIVQPSTFWRRNDLRLDESYHYAFDWKFFIEMFKHTKVVFTNKAYSVYRMYEDNKTGQDNAKRKAEIYRLQKDINVSKLNTAWCGYVAKQYEKAEKLNKPQIKKNMDNMSKVLFHITGKRICSF